jgi:hypothetical protein
VESGCSRNFEMWREQERVEEELEEARAETETGDAMAQLENKTIDSKHEMDILDALDEMRAQNARHESVDVDKVLNAVKWQKEKPSADEISAKATAEAEDAAEAKRVFQAQVAGTTTAKVYSSTAHINRKFPLRRECRPTDCRVAQTLSSSDDEEPKAKKPKPSLFSRPALLSKSSGVAAGAKKVGAAALGNAQRVVAHLCRRVASCQRC